MQIDSSEVLWSAPERERADRPLIVLMHGYGSHEGDLFSLSPALPLGPVVAAIRAPVAESGGFAWWSRGERNPPGNPEAEDVQAAVTAVSEWIDTLAFTSISLLGFSQGGAMALQLLRHSPTRFAATVCVAGFLATTDHDGDAELARVRPPVFWGRGTEDQVIPDAAIQRTLNWMPDHTTATINAYEGLAHSISREELTDFSAFLAAHI
ncbi:MAG: dienelactone hydrolase family protein [Salinibacterium sp.]|nr:dienelactone hydrolase family protein [Salinibacterium sp.]